MAGLKNLAADYEGMLRPTAEPAGNALVFSVQAEYPPVVQQLTAVVKIPSRLHRKEDPLDWRAYSEHTYDKPYNLRFKDSCI